MEIGVLSLFCSHCQCDLKNLRDEKKQLIERDRLVESIASLEKHGAFLKRIEAKEQFATPSIKERSLTVHDSDSHSEIRCRAIDSLR